MLNLRTFFFFFNFSGFHQMMLKGVYIILKRIVANPLGLYRQQFPLLSARFVYFYSIYFSENTFSHYLICEFREAGINLAKVKFLDILFLYRWHRTKWRYVLFFFSTKLNLQQCFSCILYFFIYFYSLQ